MRHTHLFTGVAAAALAVTVGATAVEAKGNDAGARNNNSQGSQNGQGHQEDHPGHRGTGHETRGGTNGNGHGFGHGPTSTPENPKPTPEHPKPTPEHPKPTPEHPTPTPEHPKPTPEHPTPEHPTPNPDTPTSGSNENDNDGVVVRPMARPATLSPQPFFTGKVAQGLSGIFRGHNCPQEGLFGLTSINDLNKAKQAFGDDTKLYEIRGSAQAYFGNAVSASVDACDTRVLVHEGAAAEFAHGDVESAIQALQYPSLNR